EIFELIEREVHRLGYRDLPSGFVLTGGSVMIPGVLELAREVLQKNVRIAIPDYIGVREPQYKNGIGLIQFAYRNVKIQGKEVAAAVSDQKGEQEKPSNKKEKGAPKAKKDIDGMKKVKNWFKVFFE